MKKKEQKKPILSPNLYASTQSCLSCILILFMIIYSQVIQAQGDYFFLNEPADTNEIVSPENENVFQSRDTIVISNQINIADTIPAITPTDTLRKKEIPLSLHNYYFPPSFTFEETEPTIQEPKRLEGAFLSKKSSNESTFLFYLIAFIIFLYALIRVRFLTYLNNVFRSFKSIRAARIQFEDTSYRDNLPKFLLLANTIFVFSLFIYWFGSRYFGNTDNPILFWAGCFFIFMLLFCLRLFFLKASAWIFPSKNVLEYYLFNVQLINIVAAWFLLPLIVFAAFSSYIPVSIMAGVLTVIWLIFVLFRLYRGYEITQSLIIKYPFYFFIYLCTLEISPVLVLYKLFVKI